MFFPAMERTKDRRGTAPMSAFAQRALIVTFPQNPLFTGVCPFGFMYVPGGQNQDLFPYYSRPTGACCHQNLKALPRERTPPPASLPVWCGGGRAENGACPNTDQLPQLFCTRRCHFNGISFKFQICRPQWAGASGITDLVFGPPVGFNQIPRRASPVTGGLGGR